MSEGTQKTGRSGSLGARYGTSVRRRLELVEEQQYSEHRCPQCLTGDLDRESTSIWECRKCGHKFAGGAYVPQTENFGKARASAEELEEVEEELGEELETDETPTVDTSEERTYGEPDAEDLVATEEDETGMDEVAEDEADDEDEDEGIESLFE
jgi:large subunit ribosomal protein L37Ae